MIHFYKRFQIRMSSLSRFSEYGKKIVAVGRNYADHAKELGNAVPTKPLLFMKPASSYIRAGQAIEIPLGCSQLHHEIELGRRCYQLPVQEGHRSRCHEICRWVLF